MSNVNFLTLKREITENWIFCPKEVSDWLDTAHQFNVVINSAAASAIRENLWHVYATMKDVKHTGCSYKSNALNSTLATKHLSQIRSLLDTYKMLIDRYNNPVLSRIYINSIRDLQQSFN